MGRAVLHLETTMEETKGKGELPKQPEDRMSVEYGPPGERQEKPLFMSFLRQNSLCRFMDSPIAVVNLKVDPDLSENVLRVMLADKGGAGQMMSFELDEDMISGEDVDRILSWVQDHMTYFFMKRFQEMAEKARVLEPIAQALQSSQTGSDPSPSETASAGPSA